MLQQKEWRMLVNWQREENNNWKWNENENGKKWNSIKKISAKWLSLRMNSRYRNSRVFHRFQQWEIILIEPQNCGFKIGIDVAVHHNDVIGHRPHRFRLSIDRTLPVSSPLIGRDGARWAEPWWRHRRDSAFESNGEGRNQWRTKTKRETNINTVVKGKRVKRERRNRN